MTTATNRIHPEYSRKITIAGEMADDAYILGGLDAMRDELRSLRRLASDPVIVGEFERLYHRQCVRVLPEQKLAISR